MSFHFKNLEVLTTVSYVSVGAFGVWSVNKQKEVFRKSSSGWTLVNGEMDMVAVGKTTVWGLNKGNIYKKTGESEWVQVDGKLTHVKD